MQAGLYVGRFQPAVCANFVGNGKTHLDRAIFTWTGKHRDLSEEIAG